MDRIGHTDTVKTVPKTLMYISTLYNFSVKYDVRQRFSFLALFSFRRKGAVLCVRVRFRTDFFPSFFYGKYLGKNVSVLKFRCIPPTSFVAFFFLYHHFSFFLV